MPRTPKQFEDVSVICKANIYFSGKVVSHTILFPNEKKKTLGLIFPGEFRFDTAGPEKMEMVAGNCRVRLAEETEWTNYGEGSSFRIPGNSHFDIAVDTGTAEYICSFE